MSYPYYQLVIYISGRPHGTMSIMAEIQGFLVRWMTWLAYSLSVRRAVKLHFWLRLGKLRRPGFVGLLSCETFMVNGAACISHQRAVTVFAD